LKKENKSEKACSENSNHRQTVIGFWVRKGFEKAVINKLGVADFCFG